MTRKEKLYNEWKAIQVELKAIKGTDIPEVTPETYTANKWTEIIGKAMKELEKCIAKKRIDDYWKSDEGQARMKELQDEADARKEAFKAFAKDMKDEVRGYIRSFLGEHFDIHFSGYHIVVGLVEKYINGEPVFYPGHDWDIYYEDDCFTEGFRFQCNYGTMGCFDLLEDDQRAAFLAGIGKFASDKTFLTGLKHKLERYDQERRDYNKRMDAIAGEAINPIKNK